MTTQARRLPIYIAIGVVICVTLWMLSGLGSEPVQEGAVTLSGQSADGLAQVRVARLQAREITREVLISGRTEPNRTVQLRAETEGLVTAIEAERGLPVEDQGLIVTLDMRDRQAQLAEAEALVAQRQLEFEAAQNLRGQRFASQVQIAQARAQLDSAVAARERIELEIANTRVRAPFAGVIQERGAEVGDFVRMGDVVADLVDLDPIIVAGEINERDIGYLTVGSKGFANVVGGRKLEGTIRYISRVADPATRTFLVELAVPNPDQGIRAGLTAELRLDANSVRVHTLSSALLTLADDGVVGVKTVDEDDRVRFFPVDIVGSTQDGIHVTGLPDDVRIITVGQGFVTEGQQVLPQDAPGDRSRG